MQLLGLLLTVPVVLRTAFASPTFPRIDERSTSGQSVCGIAGYDHGQYALSKVECSVNQCAALCKKNKKCKSYGYGKRTCRLYSVPVGQCVNRKSGSPYKFWNEDCTSPPATTTKQRTTTTTRKSVTTSSTMAITTPKTTTTVEATTTSRAAPSNTCAPLRNGEFEDIPADRLYQIGASGGGWQLDNAYFNTTTNNKFVAFPAQEGTASASQAISGLVPGQYDLFYSYSVPEVPVGSCTLVIDWAGQVLETMTIDSTTFTGDRYEDGRLTVDLVAENAGFSFTLTCAVGTRAFLNLDGVATQSQARQCDTNK